MSDTLIPPDLTACDREPIHEPGSIQPHGIMLVVDQDTFSVRHVAGNVEERLGMVDWVGQPLQALIGEALSLAIYRLTMPEAKGGFVGQLTTRSGETLDVSVQCSAPYAIIELETASTEDLSASQVIDRAATAVSGFEQTLSLIALCEKAAVEFRRFTGFDRVMVYRFLDDDAGKVLAEDRRSDMRPFLNHHFPASDIPRQARALYVRNLVRVIPDSAYEPVVLRPDWTASSPLDMSDSSLRSVSPVHLLYLRNMGVAASASFSIIEDGQLWGLVACHHETPRLLTYDARAACRSLVGSLARQIKAKKEAEGLRQRLRLRSFEDDIIALLTREGSLEAALSNHLDEIGRMMDGDGIAVLRGRELVMSGICPDEADVQLLAAWLLKRTLEPVFSTDHLQSLYPPAKGFERQGSGVLAITLSSEEPWLVLWFRAEHVEVVNWAGNPHKGALSNPATSLTPRLSFEAWSETVRGHARGWSMPEVEAATRLRASLLDVRQSQRVLELNRQLTKILQDKDLLLQQKEFLIGEVNHRVQNSLMLVSGFLSLQARASNSSETHTALEEARRRLTAVALVHRRLYRSDQIETVDAARYIEELCADAFSFMGANWLPYLKLSLAPVIVSTDRAVTLGLVLTELLINANKHAYDGKPGSIEVELVEGRKHFHMSVSDAGVGNASTRKGFGSRIMDGLVKQLGGRLTHSDNHPGLRVTVTIPVEAAIGRFHD